MRFLRKIYSVDNVGDKKVITIMGLKFSFYDHVNALKNIQNRLDAIENLQSFYMTEKPWKNLKVYTSEISAKQSAEFIIKNMPTVPNFSGRFKMYDYILKDHNKEGLYLEFGVHVGKSINAISKMKPDKTIYGFDSFEGLPETWITDYPEGHFKMDGLPEVNSNVKLIKGYFEDSLPEFVKEQGDFDVAFMNVDCDLYSSTKTIFENLKGHISHGTIICFDDFFNYPNWQEHEYKALMEFLDETGFEVEYLGYVYTNTKVALRIK